MGEAEPFVRFNCENCGYKSTVSEHYSGKNIRCPNCNYIIFIEKPESSGTTQASTKHSAYDSSFLNIKEQNILKHQQMREYLAAEQAYEEEDEEWPQEPDPATQRKIPWFIDIFLYPFNWPGLKHLTLFILVPLLFDILARYLPGIFGFLASVAGSIAYLPLFLYLYWYLAECVRESASGWVRAPQGFGGLPTLRDMFGQVINIIGCLAVFFAPFVLYMLFAQKAGIIFWLLLIYAVSLYPMTLLAVTLFDSGRGFNFRLIFKSISSTFLPYMGLVLFLVLIVILISLIPLEAIDSQFLNHFVRAFVIYAAFIGAHLLGRFYWKYQYKLNWDV